MKFLILSVAILIPYLSHAAKDGCDSIPCGTYEGSGSWYNVDNTPTKAYSEKIVIASAGPTAVTLEVYIYKPGTTPSKPWSGVLTLTFDSAGQFTVDSASGHRFGSGFCVKGVCNVAFRPVEVDDGGQKYLNAFVNTLRFEGVQLKRYNMVSNSAIDADIHFQRSELTKK